MNVPNEHSRIEQEAVETFLNLLRTYPCLFDKRSKDYPNHVIKQNAIGEIARNMHEDGM